MGSGVAGHQNKSPSPETPASPRGVGATGVEELPLPSVQPFFSFYLLNWEASLRCSSYYGAQNCLMCLFLLLMQQAGRKTEYGSPRECGQHNKTCKHNLSNEIVRLELRPHVR